MLRNLKTLDLPAVEEKVLAFWKSSRVFERLLHARRRGRRFNFYEGPPYANGKPGLHHILARVFKDIILRYKSMRGYYVPRRAGWDTHGLPVELEAEKRLGIKNKREIEALGIDVFNKRARESVFEYKGEWERMTERIGYWLDLKNAYVTCEPEYIEGLWKVFKEFDRRGRLKKDTKTIPWCPRCQTPLASHELGQPGVYTPTKDPSVYVRFKLVDEPRASLLAWTTTPWTLSANALLAVHPEFTYRKFQIGDEFVWAVALPPGDPRANAPVAERALGRELVGRRYIPLFPDGAEHPERYVVVAAPFVSAEEGTGVVHIAPAFGAEDHELAKTLSFTDFVSTINDEGVVLPPHPGAGKWIKDADLDVLADLDSRGLVFSRGTIEHEYPHCWRCSTPLIYMARKSWFLDVRSVRQDLVAANDKVNWVPAHIKHGRFGEWIKEGHDWAITRERYWGTPLPFWECGSCGKTTVVGSLAEFARLAGPAQNSYLLVRHGEAESNTLDISSSWPEKFELHLTPKGRQQIEKLASALRAKGVTRIVSSDILRTKETAEILSRALGVPLSFDERLREYDFGVLNGEPNEKFSALIGEEMNKFTRSPEGGETLSQIRARMMDFLFEMEREHAGEKIAIVSHGDPLWVLEGAAQGKSEADIVASRARYIRFGEARELPFLKLPYDREGRLDLHRPFVDEPPLSCPSCGGVAQRTKGVADVWFDSGAMPFAAGFHPKHFPADYICEALDQTRGWFYTLLAVSTLLGEESPYRNVICLGLILDKHGQKMSKSRGNVVDPWEAMGKYGVDTIRWLFFRDSSPGEPKRFDAADLEKLLRQFFFIVFNVFSFYRLYAKGVRNDWWFRPSHVLDRWISARLDETTRTVASKLDAYDIGSAASAIESFTDDLSRWYLRRSRRRFQQPVSERDLLDASTTLHRMLLALSKLLAPFTPFFADALYLSLGGKGSVHLERFPSASRLGRNASLISLMDEARGLAQSALALRAEQGIKVRQPLQRLSFKNERLARLPELLEIVRDEVNVKEVVFDPSIGGEVWLDTRITPELKAEGTFREFVRLVQDLRQRADLKPGDPIFLFAEVPPHVRSALDSSEGELRRLLYAERILFARDEKVDAYSEEKVDGAPLWVGIRRARG